LYLYSEFSVLGNERKEKEQGIDGVLIDFRSCVYLTSEPNQLLGPVKTLLNLNAEE
jgi:hypothetical protein